MDSGGNGIKVFTEQRFYRERKLVRLKAAQIAARHTTAVEFYSGVNAMKQIHCQAFTRSITNDINPDGDSDYHLDAGQFAQTILPTLGPVDLLDFDAYGNPNRVIQTAFAHIDRRSVPFVVVLTDGLGLNLKWNPSTDLSTYYLLPKEQPFDRRHPWQHMVYLSGSFLQRLAASHGWTADIKLGLVSQNKNFVFTVALIEEPPL